MATLKVANQYARDIIRFWSRVDKRSPDECWLWKERLESNGYAHFTIRHVHNLVHRFAFELVIGEIPEGMEVCHTCDIRSCCNPAHLFLGTQLDNMVDMVAKRRSDHACGEEHNQHKLSWTQVDEIRKLYSTGRVSLSMLSQQYNLSVAALSHVVRNETWRK